MIVPDKAVGEKKTQGSDWHSYTPPFALHVSGSYERREFDPETGLPEPQRVKAHCSKCDADWETVCASGQVRVHIARFGMVHLHRDTLGR